MKKKLLALLLVVAFALGSMPVNGFATNEGVQEQSVKPSSTPIPGFARI